MTDSSVVFVNYNSGQFLEACVKSVCSSNCSLEIIVVDNGSTDNSIKFLDDVTDNRVSLRLIRNQENCGFSAGVNIGVEHSNSENILLLNPDCLVFPHTIRLLCDVLNEDVSAGIVGGLVFNFDGSEQRGCRRREPTLARSLGKVFQHHAFSLGSNQVDMTTEPLPEQRFYVDVVSGSFLMVRRTTFMAVGGMDTDFFLHFEDIDLCRRVREAGWKVVFDPKISIFHYQGGSSDRLDRVVSWEKHRSMQHYHWKHYRRSRALFSLVCLLVWGHFLLQRAIGMFVRTSKRLEKRNAHQPDWAGFPWAFNSRNGQDSKQLLVVGAIGQHIQRMIQVGEAIGWSFYMHNGEEISLQSESIHCLHSEYFDKVPVRDTPDLNALLIASYLLSCEDVGRIVEKFRIRRVAIIQTTAFFDRTNDGTVGLSPKTDASLESLAGELIGDNAVDCDIRVFSLPTSTLGTENDPTEGRLDEAMQNCFSWLSTGTNSININKA